MRLALCDGVGIITLDNPPLNLITRELTHDLMDTLGVVEANSDVRTVVVCGAGPRAFSAGSDVKEFPSLMDRGTVVEEKLSFENAAFDQLAGLPQPSIAAIGGLTLGRRRGTGFVFRLPDHGRGRAHRVSGNSSRRCTRERRSFPGCLVSSAPVERWGSFWTAIQLRHVRRSKSGS